MPFRPSTTAARAARAAPGAPTDPPTTTKPDTASDVLPPATASAPAGKPIAPVADADTAPTTPPPQAAPQPEELTMTATPAPTTPPTPNPASITVTPAAPTPPPLAERKRRWLFNPATDSVFAYEVQPDGQPEPSFSIMRRERPDMIEVPEDFAVAVRDGLPRPPLPARSMPGLPAGLPQSPDLAGLSTIR